MATYLARIIGLIPLTISIIAIKHHILPMSFSLSLIPWLDIEASVILVLHSAYQ